MTLAPGSAGWGHGPWGFHIGGLGEGPWPTLAHTPGFPHVTEVAYDVRGLTFEDGTAFLVQPQAIPGQTITYAPPQNDPAFLGEIASWHIAAGGRRDRFLVLDHYEGTFYAARFQSARLGRTRGPGNRQEVQPILFRAEREVQYADVVLADQPIAYWPLREGLDANTATDLVGSTHLGFTGQSWVLRPTSGPLVTYTGSTSAFALTGSHYAINTPNPAALDIRLGSMVWEWWFRTSTTFTNGQGFYDKAVTGATQGFNAHITASGGIRVRFHTTATTFGSLQNTGSWHHVVARAIRPSSFLDVWVDARMIGSISISAHAAVDLIASATVLGKYDTANANVLVGQLAEVAVYSLSLSSVQILAHYQAGTRVRG